MSSSPCRRIESQRLLSSSFINEICSSIFQTNFKKKLHIDLGSLAYVGIGFKITKLWNSLEYELFQNFIKEKLEKREKSILKRKNLTIDVNQSIAKFLKGSQMASSILLMFNSQFSGKLEVSFTSLKSIDKARMSKESRKDQKGEEVAWVNSESKGKNREVETNACREG